MVGTCEISGELASAGTSDRRKSSGHGCGAGETADHWNLAGRASAARAHATISDEYG